MPDCRLSQATHDRMESEVPQQRFEPGFLFPKQLKQPMLRRTL